MRRAELRVSYWFASACALLAFACESTKQVGSECAEGVCPRANAVVSSDCIASSTISDIAVIRATADQPELAFEVSMCIPRPLPIDGEGRVACRLSWLVGEGEAEQAEGVAEPWRGSCSDLPFLEPDPDAANLCVVAQLSAAQAANGDGDGWYYDADYDDPHGIRACRAGLAMRFTPAAQPPSGVVVKLLCSNTQAVNEQGELVDVAATECGELPDGPADDVGAACLPAATPEGGFDDREAYVELGSQQCGSEACLVFHLLGDPHAECATVGGVSRTSDGELCANEEQIADRAYCSCRCDAPAGDPGPLCECGEGFGCVEALPAGVPGVRGSYCVREGT